MTDDVPVFDPVAIEAAEKPKRFKVLLRVTDPDGNVAEQEYGAVIQTLVNMPPQDAIAIQTEKAMGLTRASPLETNYLVQITRS